MSFWQELNKPFFVLAPLSDVTDAPFRRMIAKYSKWDGELPLTEGGLARTPDRPIVASQRDATREALSDDWSCGHDVMFTEFVSADGLVRATPEGKEKLMADLIYSEGERPIVAQLFSGNEAYMEKAAKLCVELGFDGIDINMGCPDRSIEKQGAGAAMIKNPESAKAIIRAAKRGAGSLPVSVKTRLGYNKDELEEWLPALLSESPSAVTIHARTRKEMSKVPARWDRVKRAVEIRNQCQGDTLTQTLILGNGDVLDMDDARAKARASNADGIMLGRAIFGNPWLFADFAHTKCDCKIERPLQTSPLELKRAEQITTSRGYGSTTQSRNSADQAPSHGGARECVAGVLFCEVCGGYYISSEQRLNVMIEHTKLFCELLPFKNFAVMKKHYKAYVNGFEGSAQLRGKLMETDSPEEVERIVHDFLQGSI